MRIYDQKKTSAKIVQKSDLGGSWALFGMGLWDALERLAATFGRILTACWTFQIITMGQDGLQEAFWMAFGSILGGFGENLDASWENLGIQN